jgi:hypothetical protein
MSSYSKTLLPNFDSALFESILQPTLRKSKLPVQSNPSKQEGVDDEVEESYIHVCSHFVAIFSALYAA